jgi:hypothetical protein
MRCDPHPYKPFAPVLAPPEATPIYIDFKIPAGSYKAGEPTDSGTEIFMTVNGFLSLLEEVTGVMLKLEPTRDK